MVFNTFAPRLIQAVREKTAGLHVTLRGNFSGPVSTEDLVKSIKDLASLVVCTRKKFFGCSTDPVKVSKDAASLLVCTRKKIFYLGVAGFL